MDTIPFSALRAPVYLFPPNTATLSLAITLQYVLTSWGLCAAHQTISISSSKINDTHRVKERIYTFGAPILFREGTNKTRHRIRIGCPGQSTAFHSVPALYLRSHTQPLVLRLCDHSKVLSALNQDTSLLVFSSGLD